jgi:hypothetical protein
MAAGSHVVERISPRTGLPVIRGADDDAPIESMSDKEIYALIHKVQEGEDIERVEAQCRVRKKKPTT